MDTDQPHRAGTHADGTHRALFYEGSDRFVAGAGAFLREGLDDGDRVLAAATAQKLAWLREDLGGDAGSVEFVEAGELYGRPGPMFTTVMSYLEEHAGPGGGRVRVLAEHALERRAPAHVRAYLRYEAAANVAYDRFAVSVLCPYDAGRLPPEIIEAAQRTHPESVENGRASRSHLFTDPRSFVRDSAVLRSPPPEAEPCVLEVPGDLAGARTRVRIQAAAAGLGGQAVEDLLVAVTEVATNAMAHGAAPRRLWSYVDEDDGALVCHVRDAGAGLRDPLVGYLPPDAGRLHGRGMWLAHQLCDSVEVASGEGFTDVYLYASMPSAT